MEDLKTWSQFYDALQTIDQEQDIIAYEETGVPGDLESYWGYARTAYTEGKDPWIRGDGANPDVVIGNEDMEEDRQKTDGMIKACVNLADEFSSDESAQRGDEDIPSLMISGRVASFNYALATANRWRSVSEDVQIGWNDGQGDFMLLPHPKLDADFGNAIGIDDLSGHSGEHGGHVWGHSSKRTRSSQRPRTSSRKGPGCSASTSSRTTTSSPRVGEHYEALPGMATKLEPLKSEYDLPQNFQQSLDNQDTYGAQYSNTGGPWDVWPSDPIRWTDINETISQAIAGQHSAEGDARHRPRSRAHSTRRREQLRPLGFDRGARYRIDRIRRGDAFLFNGDEPRWQTATTEISDSALVPAPDGDPMCKPLFSRHCSTPTWHRSRLVPEKRSVNGTGSTTRRSRIASGRTGPGTCSSYRRLSRSPACSTIRYFEA